MLFGNKAEASQLLEPHHSNLNNNSSVATPVVAHSHQSVVFTSSMQDLQRFSPINSFPNRVQSVLYSKYQQPNYQPAFGPTAAFQSNPQPVIHMPAHDSLAFGQSQSVMFGNKSLDFQPQMQTTFAFPNSANRTPAWGLNDTTINPGKSAPVNWDSSYLFK